MSKTVNIDGTDHNIEAFSDEQKMLLEHCVDLDRKLAACLFQADQHRVAKDAFLAMLKKALDAA